MAIGSRRGGSTELGRYAAEGTRLVNEPLPHQLTVGRLRESLRGVPDHTVVCLVLPAQPGERPLVQVLTNARVEYSGGPVLKLYLVEETNGPSADV